MTDEPFREQLEKVNEMNRACERLRIAEWLYQRAKLLMNNDRDGALELSLCAKAIGSNKIEPEGDIARDPYPNNLKKDLT